MKKALLVSVVLFTSSFAHAQLSSQCVNLIHSAAEASANVNALLKNPDSFTSEEVEFFKTQTKAMVQSTINTCVGLEEIRIQRSFRGKIGLISNAEIERRTTAVAEEAETLFESLTK